MRGMRGIGLVLVDERSGGVLAARGCRRRCRGRRRARAGLVARVSTMKLVGAARRRRADRPACSGMKIVPLPPLVTRSRPWSKNWPKNVIQALNGADRPASGVTFGMKKTCLSSAVPNRPSRPGLMTICTPSLRTSSAAPRMPSAPDHRRSRRPPDCWRSGRRSGWRWCAAASRTRCRWSACRTSAWCRRAPRAEEASRLRPPSGRSGQQAREDVVGRAELGLVDAAEVDQVVERCRRPCAGRRRSACSGSDDERSAPAAWRFGDLDLVEDEVEVGADEVDALAAGGRRRSRAAGGVGGGVGTSTTGAVGAENTVSVTPCASW